jgi:hypothetical protein
MLHRHIKITSHPKIKTSRNEEDQSTADLPIESLSLEDVAVEQNEAK